MMDDCLYVEEATVVGVQNCVVALLLVMFIR